MNDRIEGIVINQVDYKENDQIITIISETYGRISLYCKGIKKMSSKNASSCQLLDYSSFMFDYYPNKNIQVLKSASLIEQYPKIKEDYEKIAISSLMCEIISQTNCADDFKILKDSLDILENTDQPYLILNLFLAVQSQRIGVSFYVDGCVLCNRSDNIETISLEDGGFLCKGCNQGQFKPLPITFLKKFRYINKASYTVYDKLVNLDLNDFKLTDLLVDILVTYSGISLNSYKLLTNINS